VRVIRAILWDTLWSLHNNSTLNRRDSGVEGGGELASETGEEAGIAEEAFIDEEGRTRGGSGRICIAIFRREGTE